MQSAPIIKDLVLLGGGHTHVLVLRRWAMKPVAGIRLTLISQDRLTPYSGMLPGLVAGHYSISDTHIDLGRLCRWANTRFICARASGIDLDRNRVVFDDRPGMGFDVLGIDTGSTPDMHSVPGAAEHAVPVKPVYRFRERWEALQQRVQVHGGDPGAPMHIGVVGGGVGGYELLLSMQHQLNSAGYPARFSWIVRGDALTRLPTRAREIAVRVCRDANIEVVDQFDVVRVSDGQVHAADGRDYQLDEIVWCTSARAPDWPASAGLKTVPGGFIETNDYLQSVSHAHVFASGDVGTQIKTPAEKAGVFAVRQAPVLYQNLRASLLGRPLKAYRPQRQTLKLVSLGEQRALAVRNGLCVEGAWVWRWKDWIDRRFMRRFSELPQRRMPIATADDVPAALVRSANHDHGESGDNALMRCGGCGAKVGAGVLSEVLGQLDIATPDEVVTGLADGDDMAVLNPESRWLMQTVDQIRDMVNDPYLLGRIAALHSMSDVFASGAEAHSALAIVNVPFAELPIQQRDLEQVMQGAVEELQRAGCALIGGHTSEAPELSAGFVINALVRADTSVHVATGRPGDVLILTKPLGIGTVLAAEHQLLAPPAAIDAVSALLLQSNLPAMRILRAADVHAMTDVTGFGLLGHLSNMLRASGCEARLQLASIPFLPAALTLAEQGVRSSLSPANQVFLGAVKAAGSLAAEHQALLCDPQTGGGLLAAVPAAAAENCVKELQANGVAAVAIGELAEAGSVSAHSAGQASIAFR